MGWQAVAAAAGNAATGILGNVLNNRYAKKQLERQNEFNKEMWALDNAYNSPAAQMERLRAAGLNPNLVYGNGSAVNTSKGPVRSDDYLKVPSPTGDLGSILGDSLATFQDVRMKEAQIDNIQAQTDNTNARTTTEGANTVLKRVLGEDKSWDVRMKSDLYPYNITMRDEEARQASIKTDQMLTQLLTMKSDEAARRLDVEYKRAGLTTQQIQQEREKAELLFRQMSNDWMKLGVTTGDNPILRVVVRMMNEAGIKTYDDLVNAVQSLFR